MSKKFNDPIYEYHFNRVSVSLDAFAALILRSAPSQAAQRLCGFIRMAPSAFTKR
jgi:hypothetical protein